MYIRIFTRRPRSMYTSRTDRGRRGSPPKLIINKRFRVFYCIVLPRPHLRVCRFSSGGGNTRVKWRRIRGKKRAPYAIMFDLRTTIIIRRTISLPVVRVVRKWRGSERSPKLRPINRFGGVFIARGRDRRFRKNQTRAISRVRKRFSFVLVSTFSISP